MSPRTFPVTLERGADETYLAWVDDLPGCAVRGPSKEVVLGDLPGAIGEFLAWVGEPVPQTIEVTIAAEVDSEIAAEEDTEVLIEADRRPLTGTEWSRLRAWVARSRAELLELLERLPDDQLTAKRPGSQRTLREEIEHVAFVELMYAMWTFDLQSRTGLAEFLAWTRHVATNRLGSLADAKAADMTWADWGGAPKLEPWTPRKAARRLVWHELMHLRALERFPG
jgi:predicted RNase H-like HicB family nuclease